MKTAVLRNYRADSKLKQERNPMQTAAIIGAGPGGLVAARYLEKTGFETTLFDQGKENGTD